MPFREPRGGNLASRIDSEIRERVEDALDAACLDVMVRAREMRRLPAPVAGNERDRAEYRAEVVALLERLDAHFARLAPPGTPGGSPAARSGDGLAALIATQVALARRVPDYWQRFDAVRLDYAAERSASGGESRGLLRRIFGLR